MQRAAWSRPVSLVLLCTAFWLAAAAGFSGFIGKWSLRDGHAEFGIEQMLAGTADKPYVYRRLVPLVADFAERLAPIEVKERVVARLHPAEIYMLVRPPSSLDAGFRYVVVYYFSFLALFASLFLLRRIALDAGAGHLPATLASMSFALAFPFLQTMGGFYYDSVELLFFAVAFLAASRGRGWLLVLLAVPATLNKESFFFFIPALYPVLRARLSGRGALAVVAGAIVSAGLVNVAMKLRFYDAPGGAAAFFQLFENLERYFQPSWYAMLELTYGVLGPEGAFFGTLLLVTAIVVRGWPDCPPAIRQHALLALAINLPLFLVFSLVGELRNLSLLFIAFVVLGALAIKKGAASSAP
jgi:hypothetical protein